MNAHHDRYQLASARPFSLRYTSPESPHTQERKTFSPACKKARQRINLPDQAYELATGGGSSQHIT